MNRTFKNIKNDPIGEYEARQDEILDLLKQIEAGLEKHDRNASSQSGGAHWGHVGDLTSIADTLRDLKDRLHGSGEYAERYSAYNRNGKLVRVSVPRK